MKHVFLKHDTLCLLTYCLLMSLFLSLSIYLSHSIKSTLTLLKFSFLSSSFTTKFVLGELKNQGEKIGLGSKALSRPPSLFFLQQCKQHKGTTKRGKTKAH